MVQEGVISFEEIMARLDELEKEENEKNELENESKELKKRGVTVEDEEEVVDKKIPPKGVSQEEFEKLCKRIDEMMDSSDDDEDDYEDEDMSDSYAAEEDEDVLDSDDSLPSPSKESPKKIELKSPSKQKENSESKKGRIRFTSELEAGPTIQNSETSTTPKSILRNREEKPLVDEEAIAAMNEPQKKILPATDAFKGVFVERDLKHTESGSSTAVITNSNRPMSKFKTKRVNLG